jgi:hypothetical protein
MCKQKRRGIRKRDYEAASTGILMAGIGVIFLADIGFWPWILVVFGLAGLPASLANKGFWAGIQGLVWMIGLAILFETGQFFPGILILIGLSMIAGALVRPPLLDGEKRKRGFHITMTVDANGNPVERGDPAGELIDGGPAYDEPDSEYDDEPVDVHRAASR